MDRKELNKAMKNAKDKGFGIYDTERNLCINPDNLSFIWDTEKRKEKVMDEVVLLRSLMNMKDIYKEKFDGASPYELKLLEKDPAEFVERMIRAVEICTLNYVLQIEEGALNLCSRANIVKGKRRFLWED